MPPSLRTGGAAESARSGLLDPTRPTTRLLRAALTLIAVLVSARLTVEMFLIPIWGVDVIIPLRAAARWAAGGQPYLAGSFHGAWLRRPVPLPADLLPRFAVVGLLPVVPVIVAASVLCALAAYGSLRRLGLPPLAVAAAFLWPPVSGTIRAATSSPAVRRIRLALLVWVSGCVRSGAANPARMRGRHLPTGCWAPSSRRSRSPRLRLGRAPAIAATSGPAWSGDRRARCGASATRCRH